MKNKIVVFLVAVLAAGVFATGAIAMDTKYSGDYSGVRVDKSDGAVKVFIGTSSGVQKLQPLATYKDKRADVLKSAATADGNKVMDALVVYNKFLSLEECIFR